MKKVILILLVSIFISCSAQNKDTVLNFKLINTKQLTENGDNGEAYFSSDDSR